MAWKSRIGPAVALILVASVQLYFVTDRGAKSLFRPDGLSQYYDASADAIRAGRLDVHPVHIGNEAFVLDGKCYGYFGLTPALLRIPLHVLFPKLWGRWSRIFVLASTVVTVIFTLLIMRETRRIVAPPGEVSRSAGLDAWVLLAYGLGTTTLFLSCRASVFHEAVAVAVALVLATIYCLLRYLASVRIRWAIAALALSFLTVHARIVEGVATVVALAVVLVVLVGRRVLSAGAAARLGASSGVPEPGNGGLHAAVLFVGLTAIMVSHVALHAAKFGLWASMPYEKHVQMDPERLAHTEGQMFRLANVPFGVYHYFSPTMIRFHSEAPFVAMVAPDEMHEFLGARIDWKEPLVGLTIASPVVFLAAVLGAWLVMRSRPGAGLTRLRIPLLGALVSSAFIPAYFCMSIRYIHDFLPALVLAGSAAAASLPRLRARARAWLLPCAVTGTLWSVAVWTLIAWQFQEGWSFVKIEPHRSPVMIPVYERYIAEHGDDALLEAELGLIVFQQGNARAGIRHLERAVELDPECDEALTFLGVARVSSDRAAAEDLLQRALRFNPHNLTARLALAHLEETHGRRSEALENLKAAVASEPFDPRARERLRAAQERASVSH